MASSLVSSFYYFYDYYENIELNNIDDYVSNRFDFASLGFFYSLLKSYSFFQ